MAAVTHLLHHILHRRPPPANSPLSPSSLLKPHFHFTKTLSKRQSNPLSKSHTHSHSHNPITTAKTIFAYRSLLSCHTLGVASPSFTAASELDDDDEDEDDDEEEEIVVEALKEEEEEKIDKEGLHSLRVRTNGMELPSLSVKEKKELASYAHSLGKKLKSQLVGKSGVTSNVATSFVETLESNELLKIKIHRTCPGELEDVVKQLEELTCSVVVGKIGRTVILYRPSLTKLKAEEKKRQNQKIFLKRKLRARQTFQANGTAPRLSGRGRRGSSRVSSN